jgi:hypothetical protein
VNDLSGLAWPTDDSPAGVLHGGELSTLNESADASVADDTNRDIRFDQQDIARVNQAANCLIDKPAKFDQGGWNGDGEFEQLDIVVVLQTIVSYIGVMRRQRVSRPAV